MARAMGGRGRREGTTLRRFVALSTVIGRNGTITEIEIRDEKGRVKNVRREYRENVILIAIVFEQ